MTINIDYILRKMMGWCPDESIAERKTRFIEYKIESINAGLPVKKWKLDLLIIGHVCALLFASLFILPMSVYQVLDLHNISYLALNYGSFLADITLSVASMLFSVTTIVLIYNILIFRKLYSKLCYFNVILLSGLFAVIILELSLLNDNYKLEWSIYWSFVFALLPSIPSFLSVRFNKRYGQKLVTEGSGLVELIKRTMGWCPNSSTISKRKLMQFDDLMVTAPDSGGELISTSGRWNRYRNIVLLSSLIGTAISAYFFVLWGRYDLDYILTGITYGLVFSLSTGATEWHRMNKAAVESRKPHVTRRTRVINYFLIIFTLLVFGIGIFAIIFTKIDFKNIGSIMSGFYLSLWTQYLLVVYWERKNRKILIQDKTSFYAVDIEVGHNT